MYKAKDFIERYFDIYCKLPVGVDEAGRGCIAGPVVACASYIPEDIKLRGLADSKILTPIERERIYRKVKKIKEIKFAFGIISPYKIDRMNIRNASFLAMRIALKKLKIPFDFVIVDGFEIPDLPYPQKGIIKADAKIDCVSLAGILAKVKRDRIMERYAKIYPQYGFERHKGYPTKEHIEKIKIFGISKIHRKSFKPLKEILNEKNTFSR
ncbi:MAG: ribonuclease HII [candidate division WOR-3 bacterium]